MSKGKNNSANRQAPPKAEPAPQVNTGNEPGVDTTDTTKEPEQPEESKQSHAVAQVSMEASSTLVLSSGEVKSISTGNEPGVDTSLVQILIEYPEGYAGQKHMTNGKVYDVSPETAELLISRGIATKGEEKC